MPINPHDGSLLIEHGPAQDRQKPLLFARLLDLLDGGTGEVPLQSRLILPLVPLRAIGREEIASGAADHLRRWAPGDSKHPGIDRDVAEVFVLDPNPLSESL